MKFSLLILTAPFQNNASEKASEFAFLAHQKGHQIDAIFFSNDGVLNALDSSVNHHFKFWDKLTQNIAVPLWVCSASAAERNLSSELLADSFQLAGLVEFLKRSAASDRLLTFA